jgi:hypothetical protein
MRSIPVPLKQDQYLMKTIKSLAPKKNVSEGHQMKSEAEGSSRIVQDNKGILHQTTF